MIDKLRARSVNSRHFVVREFVGDLRLGAALSVGIMTAFLGGCSPRSAPGTVEDSVTSGRIRIVSASEVGDLISRERSAFLALYPQSDIRLDRATSREAIRALFGAECDLAAISRELRPEERRSASDGGLELEGYRFARNAVLVIVHPSNPVENLSLEDVRLIYKGEVSHWRQLGGSNEPVVPVAQPPEADVTEFFGEEALGGQPMVARARMAVNDSAVVTAVARERGAVGYIALGASTANVKVARISTLRGLPYWKPDLEAIYRGDYPLTRFFNLYVRAGAPRLAGGFITFVTSMDGQRLVKEMGLVPTSVPVRFVRRSPMLSTHSRGDSISTP